MESALVQFGGTATLPWGKGVDKHTHNRTDTDWFSRDAMRSSTGSTILSQPCKYWTDSYNSSQDSACTLKSSQMMIVSDWQHQTSANCSSLRPKKATEPHIWHFMDKGETFKVHVFGFKFRSRSKVSRQVIWWASAKISYWSDFSNGCFYQGGNLEQENAKMVFCKKKHSLIILISSPEQVKMKRKSARPKTDHDGVERQKPGKWDSSSSWMQSTEQKIKAIYRRTPQCPTSKFHQKPSLTVKTNLLLFFFNNIFLWRHSREWNKTAKEGDSVMAQAVKHWGDKYFFIGDLGFTVSKCNLSELANIY